MIIAVCDDREKDREFLKNCLTQCAAARWIEVTVAEFASGEALLSAAGETPFDAYYLDILMDGINGVSAAREIRREQSNAVFIFTTTSRDYMADGFDLGAVHYLVKPFDEEKVEESFDRCLRLLENHEKYIEVMEGRGNRRVRLSQLMWCESLGHYCILHTTQEDVLRVRQTLEEIDKRINDRRFLRCHRSYLINLDYVREISGMDVVMTDGTKIPVRRGGLAETKRQFEDYLFEKTRGRE